MPTHVLLLALSLAKSNRGKNGPARAYAEYLKELDAFVAEQGGGEDMRNAIAAYHALCGSVGDCTHRQACQRIEQFHETTDNVHRLIRHKLFETPRSSDGHVLH